MHESERDVASFSLEFFPLVAVVARRPTSIKIKANEQIPNFRSGTQATFVTFAGCLLAQRSRANGENNTKSSAQLLAIVSREKGKKRNEINCVAYFLHVPPQAKAVPSDCVCMSGF